MSEQQTKSNELLAQEIAYIKDRLSSIEKKLDEKYVSHETFDLVIEGLRESDKKIINTAMFFAAPLYAGVIGLLFKLFSN